MLLCLLGTDKLTFVLVPYSLLTLIVKFPLPDLACTYTHVYIVNFKLSKVKRGFMPHFLQKLRVKKRKHFPNNLNNH